MKTERLKITAVLLLTVLILTGCSGDSDTAESEAVSEGRAYLETLEDGSVENVRAEMREQYRTRLLDEGDELFAELAEDPDSVWEAFDDYAILGDSRAQGFQKWLPDERVLAGVGDSLFSVSGRLDEIGALSPAYIFCTYGINDLVDGRWETTDACAEKYRAALESIEEAAPNAKLFVVSMIPVSEPELSIQPILGNIPEYNAALEEMCAGMENVYYVDCTDLMDGHPEWYREDGIHLMAEAYPVWGADLLHAAYDAEIEDAVDSEFTE